MKANVVNRNSSADPGRVAQLYDKWRSLQTQAENIRTERNANAKAMKVCPHTLLHMQLCTIQHYDNTHAFRNSRIRRAAFFQIEGHRAATHGSDLGMLLTRVCSYKLPLEAAIEWQLCAQRPSMKEGRYLSKGLLTQTRHYKSFSLSTSACRQHWQCCISDKE